MTRERDLDELTSLACRLWPHVREMQVIEGVNGDAQIICASTLTPLDFNSTPTPENTYTTFIRVPGPKGVVGLTAALRAMLGEPPQWAVELAEKWQMEHDEHWPIDQREQSARGAMHLCAAELLTAAKGKP
jgi:hypothetical protein